MEENKNGKIQPWIGLERFWFDDPFFREFLSPQIRATHSSMQVPRVDIEDKGDTIVVKADMPGIDKKGIKLHVEKDSVSIRAERNDERETTGKNYYSRERSSFGYHRSFSLPEEVKSESAKARYENGILTLEVKKAAPGQKGKDIQVD